MVKAIMLSPALLVTLLILGSYSIAMAGKSVNIYHEIETLDPIQVDCSKGSKALAPQTLLYTQHFGWSFHTSMYHNTKYFCQFAWNTLTATVRVWWDSGPCDGMVWHVRADGFYRSCPVGEVGDAPVKVSLWHGRALHDDAGT